MSIRARYSLLLVKNLLTIRYFPANSFWTWPSLQRSISGESTNSSNMAKPWPKVFLFGDSLTQDIGIERQKIAVISPPSCVDSKWEAECSLRSIPFGKYNTATKPYAQASMAVAKEFGTQSIDLYSSMMAQEGWEDMLNDGLHLSAKGSNHLFQLIKPLEAR
ncbi:IAH1-like protein, partial [Mya arenaria]